MINKYKIGFIGVGIMGQGMAKNLLADGHEIFLIAHNNRQPIDYLVGLSLIHI